MTENIMTKERLKVYRSNRQEIEELDYNLKNRYKSESMLGSDVIFDYGKGYPIPQAVVGFDYTRYERLQDRDLKRKEYLEKECKFIEDFIDHIENSITRRIFQLYFINGKTRPTQSKIARMVHVERSNISKKIDEYLKVSQKSQKSHV